MALLGDTQLGKFYRLNDRIYASSLRVIGPDGSQIGVLTKDEALKRAAEMELDLVEIAPQAKPPVAKIVDFNKFKYEESKKEQAAKKHAKDVELKELWFTPRIAEHDLQTRLRRVDEFLADGHRIFIRIKFLGRELAHKENGYEVLKKIMTFLGDKVIYEREPKFEGRSLTAIIGKSKGLKVNGEGKAEASEAKPVIEPTKTSSV